MTDLNPSNTFKNNLTVDDSGNFSDPLHSFETLHENVPTESKNIKGATAGTSYSNAKNIEKPISPGTEVYASVMSEDSNSFDEFPSISTDELGMLDTSISGSSLGEQSKKYCVSEELDKALFINRMKNIDIGDKYNLDKQDISSNSKNKNSSNFFFSQLLNKKQNNSFSPKSSGNPNNFKSSPNSKQNPSCQSSKNGAAESSDGTQHAQMKTKLKSMWNNVKYGWRIKREVNLKTDSQIWLLGRCYHNKLNDDATFTQDVGEQLRLDLLSKIWLTYRINFPAIPGTNIVSDTGWGCMLRCGQMMMAQALVCHFLERDWRLSSHQSEAANQLYKSILRWFGDSLSDKSPFSVHHLVLLGENYGRKAGDWYGPTHAAHVLRDALHEAKKHNPLLQQLCMYVASDGIVFKQDIMELCFGSVYDEKTNRSTSLSSECATESFPETQTNSSNEILKDLTFSDAISSKVYEDTSEELKSFEAMCPSYSEFGPPSYSTVKPKWKSLILFVSVRLGNDKINPFYIPCLKSLLAYEHCIGIIGGRPKHALYFIGWQDDKIIHMDPHSCQPAIDVEKEDFSKKSFHSSSVRLMSFSEMDPSCSIGFYFRELEEFQSFVERFSEITAPLKRNLDYPAFALVEGRRIEAEDDIRHPIEKHIYPPVSDACAEDDDDDDDDDDNDYILL